MTRCVGRIGRTTAALLLIGAATIAAAAPPAANEGDQLRADALIAAINWTAVARSQWVQANVVPDQRDKVGAKLETLAARSGGLALVRTRLDGPIDKLYVRAKGGSASRVDLLPDEKQPGQVGALFSFPWPEPYPLDAKAALAKAGGSLEKAIDERVRFSADRGDFSGTVLVRGHDGRVIYAQSFGLAPDLLLPPPDGRRELLRGQGPFFEAGEDPPPDRLPVLGRDRAPGPAGTTIFWMSSRRTAQGAGRSCCSRTSGISVSLPRTP